MPVFRMTSYPLARALLALMTLCGPACYSSTAVAANSTTQAAAIRFVEERDVGSNMVQIAKQLIVRTTTFQVMLANMGAEKATSAAHYELAAAQPIYQPRWNAVLAAAYAKHLTAQELDSLRREGKSSPYARKLSQSINAIGGDMELGGKPILSDYVTTALSAAYRKMPPAQN